MSSTRHGTTGLILQPGAQAQVDIRGLTTGRATWKCPVENVSANIAATGTFPYAPYSSFLAVDKRVVTFDKADAIIAVDFAGVEIALEEGTEPVSELIIGSGEEPIETHPKFSTFGGTPADPEPGTIFIDPETGLITNDDSKGVFYGFAATSDRAGVQSYLSARNITYRRSWSTRSNPGSLSGVGTVGTPTGAPGVASGYEWLYVGMSYTKRGDSYSVNKEWRLSGPGGWDGEIYGV